MADRSIAQGEFTFIEVEDPNVTATLTNVVDMWDDVTGSSRANSLGFIAPATFAGAVTVQTSIDAAFTNPVTLNDESDADFNLEADKATTIPFPLVFRYIRLASAGDESVNTAVLNEAVGNSDADSSTTDTLGAPPVLPGSVNITVGDGAGGAAQVYTDPAGDGILVGAASGSGTITYATGAFTVSGVTAANQSEAIVADYRTNVGDAKVVAYFRVTA